MLGFIERLRARLPWNRPTMTREEIIRAKMMIYAAGAGGAIRPDPKTGKIHIEIEHVSGQDEERDE